MITSHFKRVIPFHPTKNLKSTAPVKQLRPPFECGDGWCLNGPPFEGATTYFVCAKCSRESTNPQNLAATLRKENKRQPWISRSSDTVTEKTRPELQNHKPDFSFQYMADYCIENIDCTSPYQTPTRKSYDKTACFLQYLMCLTWDCYDTLILKQLKKSQIIAKVKANIVEYQKIYYPHKYYEECLLQLFKRAASHIFKDLTVTSRKKSGWVHLHNGSEVVMN